MRNSLCLICLLLSLLLFSCSESKVYKIGVSQCSDDDWRQKMNDEINRELMFHPEATVEIRSADDSSEKQIEDIRYFIDNDFDVIIAAPNEADALTPVISEAYDDGIPVVLFDRSINSDKFTAWQGADNCSLGCAAADYVVRKKGPGAGIIEIAGLPGSTPAVERHRGFTSNPDINVLASGAGNWNSDDAYRVADSLFELYPEVDAVFAHNDRMAIAASEAAESHEIHPLIVGIDAAPEIGLKALLDRKIDATFLYPTEGQRLVRTSLAILKGDPYDSHVLLPVMPFVDASNVDILLFQDEALKDETEKLELLKEEMDEYWTQHSSQTAMFYAVLAIVLLLFGVLFLLLRAFWQHQRHQRRLVEQNRLLQEERDKQKVLNDQLDAAMSSKLAFFTNVSHDLRTPLTLISDPVERVAESKNIDEREKFLMKIARKNVHILHRLINQILDFRKYENDKLELKLTETDLVTHLTEWSGAFEALAGRKNISFRLNAPGEIKTAFDVEKMERIFYNIVANAFKYTPEGGSITVNLEKRDNEIVLVIADTGKGISAKELPNIFDRFFQGDQINPSGSGIGLALAKAFVELHGGEIGVESEVGKGTVFTIRIPVLHTDRSHEDVKESLTARVVEIDHEDIAPVNEAVTSPDQPVLLVIDDNADIRALLSEILSDRYAVLTAADGAEGLELAQKYVPDLIICDVMMPGMDGMECCRRLKTDVTTSHIPVLMLTSCAMDEQRAAGYEMGADGYLSKPFNRNVLAARIRNLIEARQQIRRLWGGKDTAAQSATAPAAHDDRTREAAAQQNEPKPQGGVAVTAIENAFYKKFLKIFEENISNPDLSVETIAAEMGLGYSQLYRKIKSLTNYRPVELMRVLRLEKARRLMHDTEKTISEISYEVGFSNPAYFTKCYREQFGETPSDTRTNPR